MANNFVLRGGTPPSQIIWITDQELATIYSTPNGQWNRFYQLWKAGNAVLYDQSPNLMLLKLIAMLPFPFFENHVEFTEWEEWVKDPDWIVRLRTC